MQRVLEPEVMDTIEEAVEYDAMDFLVTNQAFATESIELASSYILKENSSSFSSQTEKVQVLDAGTGTARIPILIAQNCPNCRITAIELAQSMLDIAQQNIASAKLQEQIILAKVDVKDMPYLDNTFDLIISNSLLHHLANPLDFLREAKRVLRPGGGLFLRDLLRPRSLTIASRMVEKLGSDYSNHQKQLFYDSLRAAFTLEEISLFIQEIGLEGVAIYESSERHWTVKKSMN